MISGRKCRHLNRSGDAIGFKPKKIQPSNDTFSSCFCDGTVVTTDWNSSLLERATLAQLSKELGHPVIVLEVGEGEIGYDWFEAGALVEHFEGHEGEPYEEHRTEGLQTQQYVLAPHPEDPTAFQTAYFWSSRRSITAREIGNIWNFVDQLLYEAEAFDPAIDYEYLLGTYNPRRDGSYRVQNPGFITVYPSGEEMFVPDLGRVDYFRFER
jgi:hypothetical protein